MFRAESSASRRRISSLDCFPVRRNLANRLACLRDRAQFPASASLVDKRQSPPATHLETPFREQRNACSRRDRERQKSPAPSLSTMSMENTRAPRAELRRSSKSSVLAPPPVRRRRHKPLRPPTKSTFSYFERRAGRPTGYVRQKRLLFFDR